MRTGVLVAAFAVLLASGVALGFTAEGQVFLASVAGWAGTLNKNFVLQQSQTIYFTPTDKIASCTGQAVFFTSAGPGDLNFDVTTISETGIDFKAELGERTYDLNGDINGAHYSLPVLGAGETFCLKGIVKGVGAYKIVTTDFNVMQV